MLFFIHILKYYLSRMKHTIPQRFYFAISIIAFALLAIVVRGTYDTDNTVSAVSIVSTSSVQSVGANTFGISGVINMDIEYINDTYYAAYVSSTASNTLFHIYMTTSTEGTVWSAPELLVDIVSGDGYPAIIDLVYNERTDTMAIPYPGLGGPAIVETSNFGTSWTTSSLLGVLPNCQIAQNYRLGFAYALESDLTAYSCGAASGTVYMAVSDDAGATWDTTSTVYVSAEYETIRETFLSISGDDGNEVIHALFAAADTDGNAATPTTTVIVHASSTDAGVTFSNTVVHTLDPIVTGAFPPLTQDVGHAYAADANGIPGFLVRDVQEISITPDPAANVTTTLMYGSFSTSTGSWTTTTLATQEILKNIPATDIFAIVFLLRSDLSYFNTDDAIITFQSDNTTGQIGINTSSFIFSEFADNTYLNSRALAYNTTDSEIGVIDAAAGNMTFYRTGEVAVITPGALTGSGTELNPYQVTNCADLETLDDNSGALSAYYILTADVTCTEITPIAREMGGSTTTFDNTYAGFSGIFDGNGNTITYTVSSTTTEEGYVGLFGYLNGATISDLTIAGSVTGTHAVGGLAAFTSSTTLTNVTSTVDVVGNNQNPSVAVESIGGMVGYIDSGSNFIFTDVAATGDVIASSTDDIEYIGGLIGQITGDGTINTVSVTGDVTALSGTASVNSIGGIIGYIDEEDIVLNTSTYSGTITVEADTTEYVGGILGEYYYDYDLTIHNATANGTITSTARTVLAYGGIVGGFSDALDDVVMSDITNNMNIVIRSAGASPSVRGVSGIIAYHDSDDDNQYLLTDITNNGGITIYSAIENANITDIGGITGYYDAQDENEDVSTQIEHTGDITIYAAATNTQVSNVGGIVGYTYDWFGVSNVTSTGDITIYASASSTSVNQIGGFMGYPTDDTYTYNVVILSDITIYADGANTDVSGVGGIAGNYEYDDYDWYVTSTYYMGAITIAGGDEISNIGGFLGVLSDGDVFASTTYAIADIDITPSADTYTHIENIGGFVGSYESADDMTISNSFAAGTIDITATSATATEDGVQWIGGFIGESEGNSHDISSTYAAVDITITTDDGGFPVGIAGFIGKGDSAVTIADSFAAGQVSIDSEGGDALAIGGFVGVDTSITWSNNYFDITRTEQTYCNSVTTTFSGCTGVNSANADSDYFIGNDSNAPIDAWDFDTVWQIDGDYYPVLAFAPYDGSEDVEEEEEAPSVSSGGGGSYIAPSKPSVSVAEVAFSVNSGAARTDSPNVALTFTNVSNAAEVALSNTADFVGAGFVPFIDGASYDHTLTPGDGLKTVYAKLRSSDGGTLVLSDTIMLDNQGFTAALVESDSRTSTACALPLQSAAKSLNSPAVYYITTECTKRPFNRSDVYFTYFTSWDDAARTTETVLSSIPDDNLGFMPLGPLYNPASGALIKLPNDPKVYLLLGETIYHIADETAAEFQFGPNWNTWIDTVDARLKDTYMTSETVLDATTRPDGMLIKYTDDPKVYQLSTVDGVQVKRWITDEATFISLDFRWDRIVTILSSEVYPDGTDLTS